MAYDAFISCRHRRGRRRSFEHWRAEEIVSSVPEDLGRFMEVTNQMREQNAAGVIDAGTVAPRSGD